MKRDRLLNLVDRVVAPLLFLAVTMSSALILVIYAACGVEGIGFDEEEAEEEEQYIISPFDKIFIDVGEKHDVDWCLLSAIARVESEFNPKAISRSGATGIMQIMPRIAFNMGVPRDSLFNPNISATVAAQLLHENTKMLRLGKEIDEEERLKFLLACYNAGYSRVRDARSLARFYQDEYNDWYTVSGYLELLAEEEYFSQEVVKGGAFYGSDETISYVKKVLRFYKKYSRKVARHEEDEG